MLKRIAQVEVKNQEGSESIGRSGNHLTVEPRIYEGGGVGDDWKGGADFLMPGLGVGTSFGWPWEATGGISVILY